jgi:hypothetical protein
MTVVMPAGLIPVPVLTPDEIIQGNRVSTYRWEVLTHSAGVDRLTGFLDGVVDGSASLGSETYAAIKGKGSLEVLDLAAAKPGMIRLADLDLPTVRLRPVLEVEGLPDVPWGVYLVTSAPEQWSGTGRVVSLELLDRATVLAQDRVDETYSVNATTPILAAMKTIIQSAGEDIDVDAAVAATLTSARVWEAGTTKLEIVNDLLTTLYNSTLWVDGNGAYRATPYVVPARRPIVYELVDGETSIYSEDWSQEKDLFDIPNRVIAVQSGSGDEPALSGTYSNTDPDSPFSYPSRGRWIVAVLDGVETPDGTAPEVVAFLVAKARASLIAFSSVQAKVEVTILPINIRVGDIVRFRNAPAGVDSKHVVTSISLDAGPLGTMGLKLQIVSDL